MEFISLIIYALSVCLHPVVNVFSLSSDDINFPRKSGKASLGGKRCSLGDDWLSIQLQQTLIG